MLRITRVPGSQSQTLKLEGSLLEPWVDEVLEACRSTPTRTKLDLTGITFVDAAGTRLLCDLIKRGIEIAACSSFVAELLHLEVQP